MPVGGKVRGMDWTHALEDWGTWLAAAGKPDSTRYLRLYQVRRFAREHEDPWAVTGEELVEWLGAKGWALETMRSYRAALRSFYGWAHRSGRVAADPSLELPPVRPAVALPRPTPEGVLRDALASADDRVRVMILLASRCGLRRAEIAQVNSRDVEEDLIGWSLVVHGKGRRERRVPLPDEVRWSCQATRRMVRIVDRGWEIGHGVPMANHYLRVSDLVRDAADRHGLDQAALAAALGISRPALNQRLNCHTRWTLSEVVALSQLLDLNPHALLDSASDGDEVLAS